tara:strand:+ start:1184 stop:1450 length:267 start_codon:yes stop_codon:yes gene_type:complete
MKNKILVTGIALSAFLVGPSQVVMADADVKPSYSNKKAGKVVFAKDKQDDISVDVSDIEPAAGAEEPAEVDTQEGESSLAEDMKLPRK